MAGLVHSIEELVGRTPLMALDRFGRQQQCGAHLLAKLEFFNPTGSMKDRAALSMLNAAEEAGLLKPGGTIVEQTSGNTGIGLAAFAAERGYKLDIFLERGASLERRLMLLAYGARLLDYKDATGERPETKRTHPWQEPEREATLDEIAAYCRRIGAYFNNQAANPANPEAHYRTTGPEIWQDTDGEVDFLVAGVGTGGTLSGAGKYLKEQNRDIKVIAVEPKDSPVLSEGHAGSHKLQGIGAGFVPYTLDIAVYDEVIAVTTEQAFEAARILAREDAVLAGISSGAALYAAEVIAARPENKDKNIVVIFPDSGEKYLSGSLYD